MEGRLERLSTNTLVIEENVSLSKTTEVIEISIGQAHSILHSIEDFTGFPPATNPGHRNRDSGFCEAQGDIDRRLLSLQRRVEENRAYLKDLRRANFRGLQVIIEDPEAIAIRELRSYIKVNFEASNELQRLAEYSVDLAHINKSVLENALPPLVNTRSLENRLLKALDSWDLPFPLQDGRLSLCNSAKLLNSGTNKGVLEHAQLRDGDKQVLKRNGGAFQFWKCDLCEFRVRYHTTRCNSANIETTDEERRPGKGHLTLRSVFLAKSHLHKQPDQPFRYACLFCVGNGKRLEGSSTAFAKADHLADHIDRCHDAGSLPQIFMAKLYVASPDERQTGRCDLQFHRTRSAL